MKTFISIFNKMIVYSTTGSGEHSSHGTGTAVNNVHGSYSFYNEIKFS